MNTIAKTIESYTSFLKKNKRNLELNRYVSLPLNKKKATKSEISLTEEKLSTTLPIELKNYYLNDANGTERNVEKYPISEERLDIFSHQKIIGIYDYFQLCLEYVGTSIEVANQGCSEEEIKICMQSNKDYFVCVVDWQDNFRETFLFDKKHNFYSFNFDQDEHISYYISELINNSDHTLTNKSLVKLLDDSIQERIEYLEEDIKSNVRGSFFSRLWRS